ncbi:high mobility group box domain containing protein [Moniliophthora roreri MCA 2997]|uniref:High mobility group box domain containing protein n=1 Tax=Moniliophthora roreri (strain MCA 2997) TaxID=1381753 RepID=V2XDX9_MONRO|nr:high mobility group box domain containing protein [Moniliophthora roreri MCA 2997]
MFSSLAARLASRSALSLIRSSSAAFVRHTTLNSTSLSRSYFATPRVLLPTATQSTAKKPAAKKTAVKKPVKKTVAKKKPAKKTPAKRTLAKKRVAKKKDVRPKFDKQLLKPPKRPGTAYGMFLHDKFSGLDLKNKSIVDMAQILKTQAALWHELPESGKQAYRERHQGAMEQWRKDYKKWYMNLPEGAFAEIKKKCKAKGKPAPSQPHGYPKRPPGPFLAYCIEFRAQNPDINVTEASKLAGNQWKKLSDGEKEPYKQRFRAALEQYLTEVEKYKKGDM